MRFSATGRMPHPSGMGGSSPCGRLGSVMQSIVPNLSVGRKNRKYRIQRMSGKTHIC